MVRRFVGTNMYGIAAMHIGTTIVNDMNFPQFKQSFCTKLFYFSEMKDYNITFFFTRRGGLGMRSSGQ